ncbi:MAG: zinc ribbon domain-containing protein [Methanobrevibacter sp.]|uniref:zinc ribbon domain-containing protein n=1 Tax=Methanobrevibacter sp. TaxID=66852 RepID=UPI0025D06C94|nr:zinc ribbon domain-containing protein [Methanobrevibacter sp.]MBR0271181.1 zinc ribbon domain-containing protein [Methanobrevibacter sp.]
MDARYCSQCGEKLENNSNFCTSCGFKVSENENETKFCHNCGKKIDANAEICPKCGVRLENPLINTASDVLDRGKVEVSSFFDGLNRFIHSKNFIILVLAFVLLCLIVASPSIIKFITPYKEVDSSYIANPVAHEKVKFTGEYIGTTDWNLPYFFYYSSYDYDVIRVGDQYLFLQGNPSSHDLAGYEGHTVYLEGEFANTEKSTEPTQIGDVVGGWFSAHKIKVID